LAQADEGLLLLAHRQPTDHRPQVYEPSVCLVLRGAKETSTTDRTYPIAAGEFLIVSHDMPVVARITHASYDTPYVAMIVSLQRELLADLQHIARPTPATGDDQFALRLGTADPQLIDAFDRYLRALGDPNDAQALAPLARREIHYRLLSSPQGDLLRGLALGDRPAEPVAKAIELLRRNLGAHLSISNVASDVGLSTSALHHHFKAVTGTSPLQYQKQLRLLEARKLIQSNAQSVTDAAFAVGYSSPTQFSREYRRAFGRPPSKDRGLAPVR
jgi:AraC-like DNA-binding protein